MENSSLMTVYPDYNEDSSKQARATEHNEWPSKEECSVSEKGHMGRPSAEKDLVSFNTN